ncbi:magnesium transporter NIPA2 [Anthonomus grandis grandis]|uniref:magnesium transporter NIPA2 n=1 Tax=Anthonomus grandis grandis TaxID=2921223 RepID=UPI0021662078|nr:magnesium transporter NIPA2 [Anthonomus grandis grandis]
MSTDIVTSSNLKNELSKPDFYIGLALAISSSIFIGSSFIIKKISLKRLGKGGLRAGAGGYGYLKDWTWWIGFLTMGIGELANFGAYAFAPASLVTPLGALSVLVSALLASRFLNETLTTHGKMGCILCILGSIVIVIHAPHSEEFESIDELFKKLIEADFLYYVFIVAVIIISIVFYIGPRYGTRYVAVYVALCSATGSLTVMSCKAMGLAIRSAVSGQLPTQDLWIVFLLLLAVIAFICMQMNYLNKALDIFDTTIVTPIYYVMFTTMVIVVSAILFKEWSRMNVQSIFGALCGFGITVVAIVLLGSGQKEKHSFTRGTSVREYGSHHVYVS